MVRLDGEPWFDIHCAAMRALVPWVLAGLCAACTSTPRPVDPPRAPAVSQPRTCIGNPLADVRRRFAEDQATSPAAADPSDDAPVDTPETREVREEELEDLDGDGVPERLASLAAFCGATGNCEYHLYLSNHGCTRRGGTLPGVMVSAGRVRHHGVLDVDAWWKGGCVGMEGDSTHYEFDGTTYVATKSLSCDCPVDEAAERCEVRPEGCPCRE